jgi:hypothetical protein
VKQPTTYNVEAVVPFQPIGRYITEGVKTVSDMLVSFADLLGGDGYANGWESFFSTVFSYLKMANTAVEAAGKLPGADGVSYINMNSLEAMAESCRALCMKMWTGYHYKFVQITNMSSAKRGNEDDVFRVSMALQEKPVLAVSKPKSTMVHDINRNWAAAAVSIAQGALIAPLIAPLGVKKAASGGEPGAGMIKGALGM